MLRHEISKLSGFVFRPVIILILTAWTVTAILGQGVKADTKFSSLYTDTTKQCKGEEPMFTCTGYGGYRLVMGIGGVFANARVESAKTGFTVSIAEHQSVGWNPVVEWRMADGVPFAIIVRADENDPDANIPKKTGEKLIVTGLKGYEHIAGTVDAKTP